MIIDCTLSSLAVPGFPDVTPEFGVKKPDGQSITARENNRNVMLPFTRQRPFSVTEDSSTSDIETHSAFVFYTSGVALTLGDATFVGCQVETVNLSGGIVSLIVGGNSIALLSSEKQKLSWNGAEWELPPMYIPDTHAGMVENGRNLLDVLRVNSIADAMAEIRRRCNNNSEIDASGIPDFRGIMIGDYIDGIDLSAIPAEKGGDAGQSWNDTYKNNRLVVAGFNSFKHSGDTEVVKNHIVLTFRNVPLKKKMNDSDTNAGGYPATDLRVFLDGANGDGTGSKTGVTTAAFLVALKAQIGNYVLPIRKLYSNKPSSGQNWAWVTCSLWLPSEEEIFGTSAFGEANYGEGVKVQLPLYQMSSVYRTKRYNGARQWYWECEPSASSAAYFCYVYYYSLAYPGSGSSVGGVAPAFCVA